MKRGVRKLLSTFAIVFAAILFALPVLGAAGDAKDASSTAEVPSPSYTEEEKAYISSKDPVRIGYVQDRVPVSFTDKDGEFAGISRMIFDRVSELSGLKFEYIPLPEGDVTFEYLMEQELDLVSSVEFNEENKHARGILLSDPYFSSRKVVVARDGLEFRYDANLSIAIQKGSQTIKKVIGETYPNFDIVDYETIADCLDAVRSGSADLMMQNQYVVEYWIAKPIYEDLNVIPVLGLDDNLCFSAVFAFDGRPGPTEADGEMLIGVLDKAIANLTEDEIASFTIKAVADNRYVYKFSDFMYRYRIAATIAIVAALVIITLTVLLLRQRMKMAEENANAKVKRRFLSTMSHEIRTPLNGLIGLNRLMTQKLDDPEKLDAYLKQSTVTAKYLLSLVNDMLDMSSIQSQNMDLDIQPVDLGLLFDTVNSIAESAMSEKGIRYDLDCRLGCPYITGDQIRIQQVLLNLLDNARKFTSEGGKVTLTVRQNMLDSGKIKTSAVISDNGRGMSDEFQKHIFETFAQELDTVSKGNQGTGLGLPISRRLANLMGGDITFVSKKGEGSSFTFTFEGEPTEIHDQPENNNGGGSSDAHVHRPRILVAEDNELNGEIIMELLGEEGFEAELAENGKEALQMFRSSAPGTYGIILMDLLMPEMDGFEAAKAIRALGRPDAATVRIFACTANCSPEDKEKALSSGMNDFITKPIDIDRLMRKLKE